MAAPRITPGVTIVQQGAVALITLASGTPLGPADLDGLGEHLLRLGRSPDVYAVVLHLSGGPLTTTASVAQQLSLAWRVDCTPKPVVALLDGPVAGMAPGLTTFATHRVAAEAYCLQLPPLCDPVYPPAGGVAALLPRIARGRGREWALSARPVGRGEAYAAGLLTHCVPRAAFAGIIAALADGQPIDPLLDGLHRDPGDDAGVPPGDVIGPCFASRAPRDILAELAQVGPPFEPWASAAATVVASQPVLAVAGLHRLLDFAHGAGRRDCLIATCRLARNLKARGSNWPDKFPIRVIEALFDVSEEGDPPQLLAPAEANGRI